MHGKEKQGRPGGAGGWQAEGTQTGAQALLREPRGHSHGRAGTRTAGCLGLHVSGRPLLTAAGGGLRQPLLTDHKRSQRGRSEGWT